MSKREDQKKRKEEKQLAAQQKQQTQKVMMKFGLFGVGPVLLVFVLYTLLSQGRTYSPIEIAETDHLRGNAENLVSIVVYSDFQCPACATEHETMTQLWPRIEDKAHLIVRHYPVTTTHAHSWTAALYAEAASRQGRFWDMHDYLFAYQPIWSGLSNVEAEFESYALELNLDVEQLRSDVEADDVIEKVRNDQRGGTSAGVRSTPAIFVNGRLLARPSRARITEIVEEEFAEAAAAG